MIFPLVVASVRLALLFVSSRPIRQESRTVPGWPCGDSGFFRSRGFSEMPSLGPKRQWGWLSCGYHGVHASASVGWFTNTVGAVCLAWMRHRDMGGRHVPLPSGYTAQGQR